MRNILLDMEISVSPTLEEGFQVGLCFPTPMPPPLFLLMLRNKGKGPFH